MPYDHLVIVADDNRDLAETTCDLLQIYGINASPAFSGQEAISFAHTLRPEVIVLDIGMPPPDGFATFNAIRALHGCSTVPIIALTAFSDPIHSRRITETGFATHIVKPANIELLTRTIKRLAEVEASKAWASAGRYDALTAQRLEVALVYKEMLGYEEARKYLKSVSMPSALTDRVLDSELRRT